MVKSDRCYVENKGWYGYEIYEICEIVGCVRED